MSWRSLWWVLGGLAVAGSGVACGSTSPDDDQDAAAGGLGGSAVGGSSASGGGSGGTGGGGLVVPPSKLSACFEYVLAQCERRNECAGWDYLDCPNYGRNQCPDVLFSEGSPRTVESMMACAKDWRTLSCDEVNLFHTPDCAVPGTKEEGEACTFSIQCASLACSANGVSCGLCMPLLDSGAACVFGENNCPEGEECLGSVCTQRVVPEEPTGTEDTSPAQAGQPCSNYYGCEAGSYCSISSPGGSNICNPAPVLGDDCPLVADSVYACPSPLYCDGTSSECAETPATGQPCIADPTMGSVCGSGDFCVDGTCTKPAPLGGDCTSNYCAAGSCDAGICKPTVLLGHACDSGTLCETHTLCQDGHCTADDTLTTFAQFCTP